LGDSDFDTGYSVTPPRPAAGLLADAGLAVDAALRAADEGNQFRGTVSMPPSFSSTSASAAGITFPLEGR